MSTFAIVGAGASGTILALHLAGRGAEGVTLIERERIPGRGTAYGTRRPEHLLNVTAGRMIVDPDDPGRFRRWVEARGGGPDTYAERRQFGDFLAGLLAESGDAIETVSGEAVAVEAGTDGEAVRLADGRAVAAKAVILASGNLRPAAPAPLRPADLDGIWVDDPWFGDLDGGLEDSDTVLLVGTGLTAIDAALTLGASGFGGQILGLSRRGLVPRPHLSREPAAEPASDFPSACLPLLRGVRARADAIGWREAVHEVRTDAQRLWAGAPLAERRRFLRHLRPWWDVHRHRIAPAVAAGIARLEGEGRLAFAAGRIRSVSREGEMARVTWRPRGDREDRELLVRRIVNCSGPELDIARSGDPLLSSLLADGRVRPDSCRLGIDVDSASRVRDSSGQASETLYAIGPMTRGAFWESIAVSDIAVQARDVARHLTGRDAAYPAS